MLDIALHARWKGVPVAALHGDADSLLAMTGDPTCFAPSALPEQHSLAIARPKYKRDLLLPSRNAERPPVLLQLLLGAAKHDEIAAET
jgi:hypothetical protein